MIEKFFKEFCKNTNRSGGVFVGRTIHEFINFCEIKLNGSSMVKDPLSLDETIAKNRIELRHYAENKFADPEIAKLLESIDFHLSKLKHDRQII